MAKRPTIVTELIRAIRQSDLTRYQIAKLSGVSQGMLSLLVNGQGEVRLSTAEKIADAIGCKLCLTKRR